MKLSVFRVRLQFFQNKYSALLILLYFIFNLVNLALCFNANMNTDKKPEIINLYARAVDWYHIELVVESCHQTVKRMVYGTVFTHMHHINFHN